MSELNLTWKLKLVGTQLDLSRAITTALTEELDKWLKPICNSINRKIRTLLGKAFRNSPEYKSLMGEKNIKGTESLRGHFGFDDTSKIDTIIDQWVDSVHTDINLRKGLTVLRAGLTVYAIKENFTDVLGLPEAFQETGKSAKIGPIRVPSNYTVLIPWLKDLLFEGDKTLIADYMISFDPRSQPASRSGQAIMLKAKGRRWFVPTQFAGTKNDNWVTRTLIKVYPKMTEIIESTIVSYLQK